MKAVWLALFGTLCFRSDEGTGPTQSVAFTPRFILTSLSFPTVDAESASASNFKISSNTKPCFLFDPNFSYKFFSLMVLLKKTKFSLSVFDGKGQPGWIKLRSRWSPDLQNAVLFHFTYTNPTVILSPSVALWGSSELGSICLTQSLFKSNSCKIKPFSFGFGSVTWSRMNAGENWGLFILVKKKRDGPTFSLPVFFMSTKQISRSSSDTFQGTFRCDDRLIDVRGNKTLRRL